MQTNLKDISPIKKSLSIEVEPEEVDNQLDKAFLELRKGAKVPGFRPGKVPRSILEQRFGEHVREEVTRNLINQTLPKAIEEVEIFPLGTPLLEKENIKHGRAFKYSAVMEVKPEFELPGYLNLEVEKETREITEEDVENQIAGIRKNHGSLTPLEEARPVENDDYVVLNYEGFEDNKPIEGGKAENFLLQVGSNDFHPDLEKALIGCSKGDHKEIRVDFAEDYSHSRLAGKSVTFKVQIVDIKKMDLPELNDEFAQSLGSDFQNLQDLKTKIHESLKSEEQNRADKQIKQKLMEQITAGVDFELPQSLVQSELSSMVENVKQRFLQSGTDLEKTGISEEKLQEDFRPAAERRVKEMLMLGKIAATEDLSVAEEDVVDGFAKLAAATGQDPDNLRKYYEARNLMGSLRESLLEQKTLNYLLAHAKVTEVNSESVKKVETPKEAKEKK